MRQLLAVLLAGLTTAATASCAADDDTVELRVMEFSVACVAKVIEVKKEDWSLEGHRVSTLARGSYVIAFRFMEPASHAGQLRRMGAYEEKDVTIEGYRLREGDVISFVAFPDVLDQAVEPDVFTNLQQIKVEQKAEANKPVETTSLARPEIRESCPLAVALRSVSHG